LRAAPYGPAPFPSLSLGTSPVNGYGMHTSLRVVSMAYGKTVL
jgi:hypothetical protein